MKNLFFARLSDKKEFKLIEVLSTGFHGVADDGEVAVLPKFQDNKPARSIIYTK